MQRPSKEKLGRRVGLLDIYIYIAKNYVEREIVWQSMHLKPEIWLLLSMLKSLFDHNRSLFRVNGELKEPISNRMENEDPLYSVFHDESLFC